ncbi:MAG: hypothetical protein Q9228_006969 [Teloschistes exilis]
MREVTMIAWINALTDMPDWHRKVFDPDFTFDWKSAKVLTGYDRIHLVRFGRHPFINREPLAFRPPEQRAYEQWLDRDGRYKSSIFVDLKREFWNIGVQMVLQVREIDLTPDHPKCDSQEWHVQGQTNERICATASYIYSISNISSSSTSNSLPTLSFRRKIFPEEAIAAKGEIRSPPFLPEIYGAKHGEPIIQRLGDVALRENRVVVWPNVFPTKVDPFELEEKSKEGRLSMLTLHLIDHNRRIMSTAMVPCQRRDWWAEAVRHIIDSMGEDAYPMSMLEGKRIRRQFLKERKEFRMKHTEAMEGYEEWDFYGEPGVHDDED